MQQKNYSFSRIVFKLGLNVKLRQELTEEQYAEVEKLHDGVSELGSIDAEEYFKYGFSSGVVLMIEIYQLLGEQKENRA